MKRLNQIYTFGLGLALGALIFGLPLFANAQAPTTTTFTYQGRLLRSDDYVDNVNCNFQFSLYGTLAGGASLGAPRVVNNVPVNDGYFTVNLNFGDQFNGDPRYLETAVQCPGETGFITLTPRVTLYAAPYAHSAARVPWTGITNIPEGFADGTDDGQTYAAGTGITIGSSNVISATFDGSGAAGTVARSDHTHDAAYINAGEAAGGDLVGTYPNPSIAPTYRLPQGCDTGYITRWNGSAWVCSVDSAGASYTAGTGLNLSATNEFSLLPAFTLPQTCTADQVAKWNNTSRTWACAPDIGAIYSAGTGLTLSAGNQFSVNFGAGNTQAARGDHNHDATYINVGEAAGGGLTGTYPNPTIAANAVGTTQIADGSVGSADIADGSVDMADTRNWIGFGAGRQVGFNSNGDDVYLYGPSFTPSAAGSCLVIVNAYITSSGDADDNGPPELDTVMRINGTTTTVDPTAYNIPFAPPDVDGDPVQPASSSASYVWNVTAVPTEFGCRITDPDGNGTDWGSDETIYCRVSYICQ